MQKKLLSHLHCLEGGYLNSLMSYAMYGAGVCAEADRSGSGRDDCSGLRINRIMGGSLEYCKGLQAAPWASTKASCLQRACTSARWNNM